MSYQITKITSGELRNGIVKGIKTSGVINNSFGAVNYTINTSNTSNNISNGRRSYSSSLFEGEAMGGGDNNQPITKKARSQIIREKKQAEQIETQKAQVLGEALDKEYDEKVYAGHYNDKIRAKYTSQYSGRDLPYIHSTLEMLTSGRAIEEKMIYPKSTFKIVKDRHGKEIYVKTNKEDLDDFLGSGRKGAQVNLDNIRFEFVPKYEHVLHPEIARLSKPNQQQFIRMVETISRVFSQLDQYLENYREQFTNNELTYFETALKILREEYLTNPEFRKSFAKDQAADAAAAAATSTAAANSSSSPSSSSSIIGLTESEVQQANRDVEILLTNLLKDLHTKKMKAGINYEIKRSMKSFTLTPEDRDIIEEGAYQENPDATYDQAAADALGEEIDEIDLEIFEDDTLERGRYLEFDMMAYLKQIESTQATLYLHLKSLPTVEERKAVIKDFSQFKNIRDSIRNQRFVTSKESGQSLNDLITSHMTFMNTHESIVQKLTELETIVEDPEMVQTKLNLVEAIKLNTTLSPLQLFEKYIAPGASREDIAMEFGEKFVNDKNNDNNESRQVEIDELESSEFKNKLEQLKAAKQKEEPKKVLNQLEQELENKDKESGEGAEVDAAADTQGVIELPSIDELSKSPELIGYLEELNQNIGKSNYPMYEKHRTYLLRELERLNADRDAKVNTWEFGSLTEQLKQLLIKNGAAFEDLGNRFDELTTNVVNSPFSAKYLPLTPEALVEKEKQLDNLKQLLEARIKSNYTLKKGEEVEQMIRLREGIQMFREMGLDTDMELIEKTIFEDGELDTPSVNSIRESDIFEPVQLIKSLYKLGPHRFENAVQSLKRLPSMVYYCQYINDRFLNTNDTFIAPLDINEPTFEKFPPLLNYNDDYVEGLEYAIPILNYDGPKTLLKLGTVEHEELTFDHEKAGVELADQEEEEGFFDVEKIQEEMKGQEKEQHQQQHQQQQQQEEDEEEYEKEGYEEEDVEGHEEEKTTKILGLDPVRRFDEDYAEESEILSQFSKKNRTFLGEGSLNQLGDVYQDPLELIQDDNVVDPGDVQLFDKKIDQLISSREAANIVTESEVPITDPTQFIKYHPKARGELVSKDDEEWVDKMQQKLSSGNERDDDEEYDYDDFAEVEDKDPVSLEEYMKIDEKQNQIYEKYHSSLSLNKMKVREEFIDQIHLNRMNQILNGKDYKNGLINLDEMIKESIVEQRQKQQQPPLSPEDLKLLKDGLRDEFESIQKDIDQVILEAKNINELSKMMESLKKSELLQAEKESKLEEEEDDEEEEEEEDNQELEQQKEEYSQEEEYDQEEYEQQEKDMEDNESKLQKEISDQLEQEELKEIEALKTKRDLIDDDVITLENRFSEWINADNLGVNENELKKLESNIKNPEELNFPELLDDRKIIVKDPKSILKMKEGALKQLKDNWNKDVLVLEADELVNPKTVRAEDTESIPDDLTLTDEDDQNLDVEDAGDVDFDVEENKTDTKLFIKGDDILASQKVVEDQDIDVLLNRDNHTEVSEDKEEEDDDDDDIDNIGISNLDENSGSAIDAFKNPILSVSEESISEFKPPSTSEVTRTESETLTFTLKELSEYEEVIHQRKLLRIYRSFPNFGISDESQFKTDELIYDEDGDNDFADKLFLMEVNTLLNKGNIMDQASRPIFENQNDDRFNNVGADERLAQEMGYDKDDLYDEDESQMTEVEQVLPQVPNSENDMAAARAFELEMQTKEIQQWRDVPRLENAKIVDISRHVKVTTAGRVQSFSVTIFNGDGNGTAGMGYGKGDSASSALRRAFKDSERNAFSLDRYNHLTLPSGLDFKYRSTKVKFIKSRPMDFMDHRGIKPSLILPTIGLHGVTFRTYGKKDWNSVLLAIQKCLPHYTNPQEAARIMGKKFVTPNREKAQNKTLHQLLKSKLETRNNDPYNLGMVSKFLFDVEDKPDINEIKERRYQEEIDQLFERYPIAPSTPFLGDNVEDFKFKGININGNGNGNGNRKHIDKMHQKGRKHGRNTRNL
ncbi:hypothetical protein DDB_G0293090 [Dictyostelium discoideum AX4]|uniref:S5 DRBM domain-containing protein n=1 Tax=Dictyostelium discoideum TaxID=44689 RepID=Q54CA5_DICDI|nr:hypothetical protein DDB_G0293090 [Dictyostelium discoideum AX4]EAL60897.1 hypothetical protein DDB_G0293090 [Dictyostelium discoideum AX4]|eukprot:XP_629314.1 hypothetical protein DDB_G0293090 [Dictyostelium discoideum AX4]